jgi:hypothetical protein
MEVTKMNNNNFNSRRVVTGRVRLSYVHLLKPRAAKPGDTPKYGVTMLIPKHDIATKQRMDSAIAAAIAEAIQTKWNGTRPAQPAIPIYDGDGVRPNGEAFSEECRGHWVLTASSEQKPEIVDINCNPIMNASEIYSGMYAHVSINFFGYFNSGKKGIGCGLGNVQKVEDGTPLAASIRSAAEDFAGAAPQYAQPGYPAPAAPQYTQPAYAPPGYAVPTPAPNVAPSIPLPAPMGVPAYPNYAQQPGYAPPVAPMPQAYPQQPQIDPITGRPVIGQVMGL